MTLTPGHDVKENVIHQMLCAHCPVFGGEHESAWGAATQPYMQQATMPSVFLHLSVIANITLFSSLCYSRSSVGLSQTG